MTLIVLALAAALISFIKPRDTHNHKQIVFLNINECVQLRSYISEMNKPVAVSTYTGSLLHLGCSFPEPSRKVRVQFKTPTCIVNVCLQPV